MKLQHVEIESFMGIQQADFAVGDGGVLFTGKSKSGKTSSINAIHAALKSRGYGPECIHDNADRWRVLLRFDKATVQTIVRRSGSKQVRVDGLGIGSPQEKLDAIFPDLIDPLRLAQDKPEERRRKVLAAMFVPATADDQKRWTGEDLPAPSPERHGLDVVKELHDRYYAERTAANKAVDDAKAALKLAQDTAEKMAKPEHVGVVVPVLGEEDKTVREAERAAEALAQRKLQAEEMAQRLAGTRARIDELTAEADAIRDAGPMEPALREVENAAARLRLADVAIQDLQKKMTAAQTERELAQKEVTALETKQRDANDCTAREARKRQQARELRDTLADVTIKPPTADELAKATEAITAARAHAELVRSARDAHDALAHVTVLDDELQDAQTKADRLNAIVRRLDNEAPAELAARANMPKGVTIVGDDVAMVVDGKVRVFKLLSESEKTELCVDLVKRIAPDAKLLRIDRLEGIDPEPREAFIRKAKAGGWQILGTVVERGEMRIVTIDADDEAA